MLSFKTDAKIPPKRVLLFGGSGFLGKNLADHLGAHDLAHEVISSQQIDLTDSSSVEKVAGLIKEGDHIVFFSCLTPEKGKDAETFFSNISMVRTLTAALKKSKPTQVVYISSDGVYDESLSPVSESTPVCSSNLYGTVHRSRELMLEADCSQQNIPLAILRPVALFGHGDTHTSYGPNRFIRQAKGDGVIHLFGNGEETRDHLYVEDFSRVTLEVLLRVGAGVANIAPGNEATFKEIADIVVKLSGKTVQIRPSERKNEITHKTFDRSEIRKSFPDFEFTSIEVGLEREFDKY